MRIPIYQLDAFACGPFTGNPAAVCLLERWLDEQTMQAIARENNLSETAFVVPRGDARWGLRWFTPEAEVDLCGHATLAAGHVLLRTRLEGASRVLFETRSGTLAVFRRAHLVALDLPALPPAPCALSPAALGGALGSTPQAVLAAMDYLALFESAETVRRLDPDMAALARLDRRGVIVTAPAREVDFVCRFFAPGVGVAEDPVTGSAHATLAPFWAERQAKARLHARQLSARGGEIWCEAKGARVEVAGRIVPFLEGVIVL